MSRHKPLSNTNSLTVHPIKNPLSLDNIQIPQTQTYGRNLIMAIGGTTTVQNGKNGKKQVALTGTIHKYHNIIGEFQIRVDSEVVAAFSYTDEHKRLADKVTHAFSEKLFEFDGSLGNREELWNLILGYGTSFNPRMSVKGFSRTENGLHKVTEDLTYEDVQDIRVKGAILDIPELENTVFWRLPNQFFFKNGEVTRLQEATPVIEKYEEHLTQNNIQVKA